MTRYLTCILSAAAAFGASLKAITRPPADIPKAAAWGRQLGLSGRIFMLTPLLFAQAGRIPVVAYMGF